MSRKKHAVKKNAWEGRSLLEKWRLAQFGDAAENEANMQEADLLVNSLQEAFLLEKGYDTDEARDFFPSVFDRAKFQELTALRRNWAWSRLKKAFSEAIQTGNGAVFATMAVLIERLKKPVDPAQTFIGHKLQMCWQRRDAPPQIQEMVDLLRAARIPSSYNQVKRIYGYFGMKPTPGKPGRPKKASQ